VLDIVEENVGPGPERDALLQHWYRGKVLKRLAGRHLLRYTEEYRTQLLEVVRPFAMKRFSPDVDRFLAFPMRMRSALLRADRVDGLLALAEIEAGLKSSAQVTSIGWDDSNRLRIEIEAKVFFEDGSELQFEPTPATETKPAGWRWVPPTPFTPEVMTDEVLAAGPDVAASRVEVYVRARHDGSDYVQPEEDAAPQSEPGRLRTTITIDPRTARLGRPVTKDSDLIAQVSYAGWNFGTSLRIDPDVLEAAQLSEHIIGNRAFSLYTRGTGRLTLRARKLPKPVKVVVEKTQPLLRARVIRNGRRIASRVRRRLLRIIS
jgi:hypothetical protein